MPRVKTIAALRRELAAKEAELAKLKAGRSEVAKAHAAVEKEIAAMEGQAPARAPRQAKVDRPGGRRLRTRQPGGKTLVECMTELLAGSDGMRTRDIKAGVLKAGYKTDSKAFYNTVAATLRDHKGFVKVARGTYKLA